MPGQSQIYMRLRTKKQHNSTFIETEINEFEICELSRVFINKNCHSHFHPGHCLHHSYLVDSQRTSVTPSCRTFSALEGQ